MKEHFRNIAIVSVILLICLVIAIALIYGASRNSEEPTYPTIENAASVYEGAVASLHKTDDLSLQISYKKETLLGNEYITEQSVQTISYQDRNSDTICAKATEKLSIGTHTVDITETFADGELFLNINDALFRGNMAADTYRSRYAPAQLLNEALYNTITGEDTGNGYQIFFSNPKHIEDWAASDGTTLRQANGSAYIDANGQLSKSVYSASYSIDNVNFRITVTVEINYSDIDSINLPKQPDSYTVLEAPDAPRMLEIACGYLLETNDIQATCSDEIFCEAFGDRRKQEVVLRTVLDTAWSAQIDTKIELFNSSKAGSASVYTQKEVFKDNSYSIAIDGAPASTNSDIDINAMRSYCRDLLVETIILPQYITGAVITETETSFIIELTGNDTFARLIDAEACISLYQDGNVLNNTAQDYRSNTMNCYLEILKNTGLPVRSGLDYQGIYTIDQLPYQLTFHTDHEYVLLNNEAGA